MEIILNRWRGTGTIFYKITGVHIYALYLGLLIGSLCFVNKVEFTLIENILSIMFNEKIILSNLIHSIIGFIFTAFLFLIGESFAWGKWVGYLVSDNGEKEYWNDNGKSFPFIHQIANFFLKEKEDYLNYCRLALTIRGFIWWTPLLTLLGYIDLLSWYQVALNYIILAVGFPLACELSKKWKFNYQSKYLMIDTNWEKQEIIYGFIQFLCISFSIFITLYFKG